MQMAILTKAKDTGIKSHGITERDGKVLCWEKQGWTMEDGGLDGQKWWEGRSMTRGGKQGIVFSLGLSTERLKERIRGTWDQNHWIKSPQNPSHFCTLI